MGHSHAASIGRLGTRFIQCGTEGESAPRRRYPASMSPAHGPRTILLARLGFFLLPLALTAWSWQQWADPQIDFGREAYTAWRLGAGDVLYRDIAWFNGPLSAYWNAAWMWLLGPSIQTLALVNLGLVYVTLYLLVHLVHRWSSPVAGGTVGVMFLTVFAFGQYDGIGNFNFICPYSHEIMHGFVLCLGVLAALERLGRTDRAAWAGLAGLLLGLAFLTKAELFLAGAAAAGVRLGLHLVAHPSGRGRSAALFFAGLTLPAALSWVLLRAPLGAAAAWQATLGSWPYLGNQELTELVFYRQMIGLDRRWENLSLMGNWGLGTLFTIVAALKLMQRMPRAWDERPLLRASFFGAGVGFAVAVCLALYWRELARPFPLYMLLAAVLFSLRWLRYRDDPAREAKLADKLGFTVLAGMLLVRMALNVRIEGYGFVLVLPATALLAAVLIDALPRRVALHGGPERCGAALALGVLATFCGLRLVASHRWYQDKEHAVVAGGDRIVADYRGPRLQRALEQRLDPDDTLFVLPEGVMFNFLLRKRNPTPYINFMPPELVFWGEQRVIDALAANPPDAIALIHKATLHDYGKPNFGEGDFGVEILQWVREHYRAVATYGHPPFGKPDDFGVQILVPR